MYTVHRTHYNVHRIMYTKYIVDIRYVPYLFMWHMITIYKTRRRQVWHIDISIRLRSDNYSVEIMEI